MAGKAAGVRSTASVSTPRLFANSNIFRAICTSSLIAGVTYTGIRTFNVAILSRTASISPGASL